MRLTGSGHSNGSKFDAASSDGEHVRALDIEAKTFEDAVRAALEVKPTARKEKGGKRRRVKAPTRAKGD